MKAIGVDDQKLVRVESVAFREGSPLLARIPTIEPMLANVVIHRKKAADPDNRIPLGDAERTGQFPILWRHVESIDFREMEEDPHEDVRRSYRH
ncbi:MAG: hypothetical protein HOW73_49020 [Polyangiaceae bacterium]|nr:hypothetical protein [Polyangiaceae bacterium]